MGQGCHFAVLTAVALSGSPGAAQTLDELVEMPVVVTDTLGDLRGEGSGKASPVPPSERMGWAVGAETGLTLDALDATTLLAEDAMLTDGRIFTSLRAGVSQSVGVAIADLPDGWTEIDGVGRVWRAAITSPGARAMRLRFEQLNLPRGAELWIRSADEPAHVQGPFGGTGPFEHGGLWSTNLVGSTAIVEVFMPASVADEPQFVISEAMHIYRDLLAPMSDVVIDREGACHTDSGCEPTWHPLRDAVARYTAVNSGQLDLCTGTLLTTTANDFTPYFFTAQHCCRSQAGAESMVFYWLFQTSTCNGVVPALNSVPTSTFADLLSQRNVNVGSDYSFCLIRGALPTGLAWAGWDTGSAPNGTAITVIHHPTGAYKRIMHGVRQAVAGISTQFWGVGITSGGAVEFSTSGSPLLRDDTQRFIGQASFVTSSPIGCGNPANPAGFGRFNQAYPNIQAFLAAGADDAYDTATSNGSCATATSITAAVNAPGLVVKSVDEDWYAISLGGCTRTNIALAYTQAYGDVDAQVLDACGGSVIAAGTGTTGSESLVVENNTTTARTVYLRVFLDSSTRNTYDMNIAFSAIDGCAPAPCPGDVTGDRVVDLTDLAVLLANFGVASGATREQGDLDGDGAVILNDLAILLANFGASCP